MNKLTLYFFDEEALIDFPKDFQKLKKLISIYFSLSEKSVNDLNLCYNNTDSTILNIKNEEEFKSFLSKNISNLYLDIDQKYEIYEEYLSAKENQSADKRDLKKLNELMLKDEEYSKISLIKFKKEEDEINEINKLMEELRERKIQLVKYIKKNKEEFEKEHKKIKEELSELQIKMGIPCKYEQKK